MLLVAALVGCASEPPAKPREPVTLDELEVERQRSEEETQRLVGVGRATYHRLACDNCHSTGEDGDVGLRLAGIYGRPVQTEDGRDLKRDEQYLFRAIVSPDAELVAGAPDRTMTPYRFLSSDELLGLIYFIKSLSSEGESSPSDSTAEVEDAG
jgi:cytochrome c2